MNNDNMHRFTLVLANREELDEDLEERVFEAGCDDALLGARDGVVYLDFDRRASTFAEALESAIHDVESAGLTVARVEPDDVVNQSQIAERAERTRESIRLLISGDRGPGSFPAPVSAIKTTSRLWRWSHVAVWLSKHGHLDAPSVERAVLIARTNEALAWKREDIRPLDMGRADSLIAPLRIYSFSDAEQAVRELLQ